MATIEAQFPYANNTVDTVALYYMRKLYRDKVLAKSNGEPESAVTDTWYRRNLYGKTNNTGDFIIAKENMLAPLRNRNDDTHFALEFVSDAYNEMMAALRKEDIYDNPNLVNSPYANFTISKAWQSAYDQYYEYMSGVFESLVMYLSRKNISNKIRTFDDFVKRFFVFYDSLDYVAAPLTLSGFVANSLCPNLASGLMIEISDKEYSNDRIKYNIFTTDANLKLFRSIASKHGFSVDKNIPWRLIANLNSCYMRDKMLKEEVYYNPAADFYVTPGPRGGDSRDPKSMKNVFDIYYHKTFELDLQYLTLYMYQMWNSYIADSPFYEEYYNSKTNCRTQEALKVKKRRKVLDFGAQRAYTRRDFWLEHYFMLRTKETRAKFSKAEVKYILFNAKKVYDIYGELRALDFLNRKLKVRHKHIYDLGKIAPYPPRDCVPTVSDADMPRGDDVNDPYNKCL